MTTATLPVMNRVQVPKPLPHQMPSYEDPRPRKVLRWGRRRGKTRQIFTSAVVGHGPLVERDGVMTRLLPGIASGLDVVWIAPSRPQSNAIWNEEIVPRFRDREGVTLNETYRYVQLEGAGRLFVASAEAMDSVRGAGAKLCGAIVDEAAHQDLRTLLERVLMPMLVDNDAWLILSSTTNSDSDGNPDARVPSHFNVICAEVMDGKRDQARWGHWHGWANDNPRLSQTALQELIDEYEPGSRALQEEVYAELLEPQAGTNPIGADAINARIYVIPTPVPPVACWGLDIARKVDWTYLIGLDVHRRVVREERFRLPWGEAKARIKATIGRVPTLADATGVGDAIVADLQLDGCNVSGFVFTPASKLQIVQRVIALIHNGQIQYPDGQLVRELRGLRAEATRTAGYVRYEAAPGQTDDGVMGLALACRAYDNLGIAPVVPEVIRPTHVMRDPDIHMPLDQLVQRNPRTGFPVVVTEVAEGW